MSRRSSDDREAPRSVHAEMMGGAHLRQGWDALAMLLSGMVVFGLPSWWLSEVSGWIWILPVGLILGMGASIMAVWFRYGMHGPQDEGPGRAPTGGSTGT